MRKTYSNLIPGLVLGLLAFLSEAKAAQAPTTLNAPPELLRTAVWLIQEGTMFWAWCVLVCAALKVLPKLPRPETLNMVVAVAIFFAARYLSELALRLL
jgi:hypothetical protein